MATVVEMPESAAVENERQEVASYHAWMTFLGAAVLFAVNYSLRVDWLAGLSVMATVLATWRTFAEIRTALFALGGVSAVALGFYFQIQGEAGVVMPFTLMILGARAWTQGVCEAFSKGIVPPIDPNFS